MTYQEAQKLKTNNSHIVGLKFNEEVIEEIIIRPTSFDQFQEFLKIYSDTLDAEESILGFTNEDLIVSVVFNKVESLESGIFFQTPLLNLKDENLKLNL
ncbi:hypothetical protein [Polaribacter atrinae]|uniref:Uncharacterized protein n=1 Tax=Polaribacter atrinae TaxID=1333662 RepID=A0A176TDY1_9FLAO|nr:hypothetical protein [Polaribacter atrinae]OAD45605.1 hypothetical protein LPB303_06480 [Polaribacter atrinae]